jgi:4-amino-4-deoxy-L-arabinose transferase-like glycosyltransferase
MGKSGHVPQFIRVLLVALLLSEAAFLLVAAPRKLFWYDELLTLHVSGLQPFSHVWKALRDCADGMPPGYYVFVRLARMVPGAPEFTLRLPSILGYILSLLGVYWFARKKLPVSAGLAAVLLITLSPFRCYALEARSYALLTGCLAIAAALWQRIGERRFMTPLFALFLALAVSCHYYAVVTVSLFGIAELTWTILSRRIRWGVWTACLVATAPFFAGLPILLAFRNIFSKNFWARPDWSTALWTYTLYIGPAVAIALVVTFAFAIVVDDSLPRISRRPGEGSLEGNFSPPELALVGGFLFYPALLVVLTKLSHAGYAERYGWPAILGVALIAAHSFRSIWLKSSSAYLLAALLIFSGFQSRLDFIHLPNVLEPAVALEEREIRKPAAILAGSTRLDQRWIRLAELTRGEPRIPIVISSGVTYLEAAEYAPPELRARLVEVVDPENATRLTGKDTTEKANRIMAAFVPLQVVDLAKFQAGHERFIVYSYSPASTRGDGVNYDDWVTEYFVEKGYHLRLLSPVDSALYIVEQ